MSTTSNNSARRDVEYRESATICYRACADLQEVVTFEKFDPTPAIDAFERMDRQASSAQRHRHSYLALRDAMGSYDRVTKAVDEMIRRQMATQLAVAGGADLTASYDAANKETEPAMNRRDAAFKSAGESTELAKKYLDSRD